MAEPSKRPKARTTPAERARGVPARIRSAWKAEAASAARGSHGRARQGERLARARAAGTARLSPSGRHGFHAYSTSGARSSLDAPSVRSSAVKPWRS